MPIQKQAPPTASEPFQLSPSSIRLFQTCPRKFSHRYVFGIEGKQTPDERMQFGTALHTVIEQNVNRPAADWTLGPALVGLDQELAALVAGTALAYATYWRNNLTYTVAEAELVTPLANPRLVLLTILDGIATNECGDLVVVDHKTTSSDIRPGSWFFEKLQIDTQVSAYLIAARANGHNVTHAEWNAIKRPNLTRRTADVPPEYYTRSGKWGEAGSIKPGTGVPAESVLEFAARVTGTILASPEVYFQRAPVVRLDDEIADALVDINGVGEQILAAWDASVWPRATANCYAFGRPCEFWELCCNSTTASDEQLYQIRKKREAK